MEFGLQVLFIPACLGQELISLRIQSVLPHHGLPLHWQKYPVYYPLILGVYIVYPGWLITSLSPKVAI